MKNRITQKQLNRKPCVAAVYGKAGRCGQAHGRSCMNDAVIESGAEQLCAVHLKQSKSGKDVVVQRMYRLESATDDRRNLYSGKGELIWSPDGGYTSVFHDEWARHAKEKGADFGGLETQWSAS